MHLEEFPSSRIARLPLFMHDELLWRLPIADLCVLDESSFVEGVDIEKYWQSAGNSFCKQFLLNHKLYSEKWICKSQYAKVCCYAEIAQCVLSKDNWISDYVTIADQRL